MPDRDAREQVIFDFATGAKPWANIDDPVMGGRSASRMSLEDGVATFQGTVSLENNGGFASVRSRPAEHPLDGFDGVALRVRGDGKTYKLRLRTTIALDGVSYQTTFATESGRWIEVRLPWSAFQPVFRGRQVAGYPALKPSDIRTFGLLISDKQAGPFRLEIDWIKAWANP